MRTNMGFGAGAEDEQKKHHKPSHAPSGLPLRRTIRMRGKRHLGRLFGRRLPPPHLGLVDRHVAPEHLRAEPVHSHCHAVRWAHELGEVCAAPERERSAARQLSRSSRLGVRGRRRCSVQRAPPKMVLHFEFGWAQLGLHDRRVLPHVGHLALVIVRERFCFLDHRAVPQRAPQPLTLLRGDLRRGGQPADCAIADREHRAVLDALDSEAFVHHQATARVLARVFAKGGGEVAHQRPR
mmetsp:Transcript_11737/g.27176  ORF Transcript_11737/g.27176 Transcript_11737/m.27176 type:complete len:238 (+) Transcript_11737:340-1053(+)